MGQTAEELAWRLRVSREAMDGYALRSHQRLGAARERGDFEREIVPIFDRDGNHYADDDGYRADSSLEKLARLKPVFDRPTGSVTAGNSAQVTDGAAWLILASEDAVERHGLPVLARVHHAHWAALDPAGMGLGPVHAAAPLLVRHGLLEQGVDLWEINEAFAAQVLACLAVWHDPKLLQEELGIAARAAPIPEDNLNPDGGAIAVGHPVGASGARIVLHLALALARHGARTGVAALCIGGGQGGAMLLERSG